ncbi:hypothetical protein NLQ81_25560, partial [Escherichia coli]|nr:hypothetical protein [Escherichia coli]
QPLLNDEEERQEHPPKAPVEAAIDTYEARKQAQLHAIADAGIVADPRKTAVEAAIARAKARKLEQQQANAVPEEQVDPRKAAVEAAIAVPKRGSWNNNTVIRKPKSR